MPESKPLSRSVASGIAVGNGAMSGTAKVVTFDRNLRGRVRIFAGVVTLNGYEVEIGGEGFAPVSLRWVKREGTISIPLSRVIQIEWAEEGFDEGFDE